jgi:hypothetical protein
MVKNDENKKNKEEYSLKELVSEVIKFRDERDWKQFH